MGPLGMTTKASLKKPYGAFLAGERLQNLSQFCRHTLKLGNASFEDLTEELLELSNSSYENYDHVIGLYKYLHAHAKFSASFAKKIE